MPVTFSSHDINGTTSNFVWMLDVTAQFQKNKEETLGRFFR